MPVNDRYPLDDVLAECRRYVELRRRKVFVEYVMLAGVNDSPADANALAGVLDGRSFKVNLIPYNPIPAQDRHLRAQMPIAHSLAGMYEGSSRETIERFKNVLERARIPATVRLTRGRDIEAACGQLASTRER
jgi:23S rRNA (adenine2503-C2)-methyltransferase